MPKISIVIPAYNVQDCLESCLKSIQNQTFEDYEVICIDDGSSDRTPEILNRFSQHDNRFYVVHQANSGPGKARNTGLDRARGDYVMMLDSDDIYNTRLLELMLNEAEKTESDIVICRAEEFLNDSGERRDASWTLNLAQVPPTNPFSPHDMRDFVFTAFVGWPWDKMYRRSFIESNHLRFPALQNSEDLFFVFLSIVKAERISTLDYILVSHRVNRQESVSNSRRSAPLQFYESTCLLKRELQKDPVLYSEVSWGFLNWALSYLNWNIDTMTDEAAKQVILNALRGGDFPELELAIHPPRFFSLDTAQYERYLFHLDPKEGEETQRDCHPSLGYLVEFFTTAREFGFLRAIQRLVQWATRKATHSDNHPEPPKPQRASDYPKQYKFGNPTSMEQK